ncbi:MAG: LLM class flavin-dependent oxidoreductase [Pseudomonadota bacterium]
MPNSFRLNILDQSPIVAGTTAADALSASMELARFADRRGFHRLWYAEHHGSEALAGSAPEVLIGQALACTTNLRVGSGGVMLMHYSPYKVAEVFGMLATLYPRRVDLGVGRAPGSDGITAAALAYGSQIGIEYLPAKLADLAAFLTGRTPHSDALARVRTMPIPDHAVQLWMLGSSTAGAQLAAQFGLPYCHAHFINGDSTTVASGHYLDRFQRASPLSAALGTRRPVLALGVFVTVAETAKERDLLERCRDRWRLNVAQGRFEPFPNRTQAEAIEFSEAERAQLASRAEHNISGDPVSVAAQLRGLAARTAAQELFVICIAPDYETRLKSYALLADEMLPETNPAARSASGG